MNHSIKIVVLFLATFFFFTGCSDERKTVRRLEAIWSITSYKIFPEEYPDGLEMVGLQFNEGRIVFKSYDFDESTGNFELILEDVISGEGVLTKGLYMLDETGKELTLVIDESEDNFADVEVSKEALNLVGRIDSVDVIIEAELY